MNSGYTTIKVKKLPLIEINTRKSSTIGGHGHLTLFQLQENINIPLVTDPAFCCRVDSCNIEKQRDSNYQVIPPDLN